MAGSLLTLGPTDESRNRASMIRNVVVPIAALGLIVQASLSPAEASEELMSRSGCISCHRVDQKLLGPGFKEVAARYRSDPQAAARLFRKVRDGGEGEWGDLPMQPNGEEKVSDADLQQLLDWILKL